MALPRLVVEEFEFSRDISGDDWSAQLLGFSKSIDLKTREVNLLKKKTFYSLSKAMNNLI